MLIGTERCEIVGWAMTEARSARLAVVRVMLFMVRLEEGVEEEVEVMVLNVLM